MARTSVGRILTDRNVAPYLYGCLVANCGTWVYNVGAGVALYDLTSSSFVVGLGTFAQFAGSMLLGSFAGVLADRFDRRRLVVIAQVVAMTLMAGLAFAFTANADRVPVIIGCNLLVGLAATMNIPAMMAAGTEFVPEADAVMVTSLLTLTFNAARGVGPLLAAAAIALGEVKAALWLGAGSCAVLLITLAVSQPVRLHPPRPGGVPPRMRELLRTLRTQRQTVSLYLVGAGSAMCVDPIITLTPQLADELDGGAGLAGWLIGAFGLCGLAGGLAQVALQSINVRVIRTNSLVLVAAMICYVTIPQRVAMTLAAGVAGVTFALVTTITLSRIQVGVEQRERGRVMALWMIASLGTRPVAALVDGGLASLAEPIVAVVVVSAPLAAVVVFGFRSIPEEHSAVAPIAT